MVPGPIEMASALSRLATLPNPNDPELDPSKYVQSFWATVEVPTIDPSVWDSARAEVLPLDSLTGTDVALKRKKVAKHIESLGQALTPYKSLPLVIQQGDKFVIIDGHHRLAAQWLLGMEQAPVWLVREQA